jgi:hypothetical protein
MFDEFGCPRGDIDEPEVDRHFRAVTCLARSVNSTGNRTQPGQRFDQSRQKSGIAGRLDEISGMNASGELDGGLVECSRGG